MFQNSDSTIFLLKLNWSIKVKHKNTLNNIKNPKSHSSSVAFLSVHSKVFFTIFSILCRILMVIECWFENFSNFPTLLRILSIFVLSQLFCLSKRRINCLSAFNLKKLEKSYKTKKAELPILLWHICCVTQTSLNQREIDRTHKKKLQEKTLYLTC